MNASFDFWKMLAGIAFFLLAMNFMEQALQQLAGRPFKLYLKKQTNNKVKAIGAGAIVTGLLQSSSIVNLLVLSMVGAGVVKMENALALMLGSNLGTTLNSWIIATLGFNYNIETLVLPAAGVTGILMAFLPTQSKGYLWCKFLFSLAFLFVALGYIKTGMEGFIQQTDLSSFNSYPLIVFLLLGIVLTSIVQSSSATIALTLSALHTNAITLLVATAIVLGAEIGTTLKLFLAAAKGSGTKKRVALGNFLFNLITVVILFFLLIPVNQLITGVFRISNNLVALVFFQSFVNLFCVLLFFPFLTVFGKFLKARFSDREDETRFISKVGVNDPEIAMEALENETRHLIDTVIDFSLASFNLDEALSTGNPSTGNFHQKSVPEKYEFIKQLHGSIQGFCTKLQQQNSGLLVTERLNQLIATNRNCMYAAKSIHDAHLDIEQLRNSSNEIKYRFYKESGKKVLEFYRHMLAVLNRQQGNQPFEALNELYLSITEGYAVTLQRLYKDGHTSNLGEIEFSTLINFNRELYTSLKAILYALKDFLLTNEEAKYFDAQPGFIR